MTTTTLPTGTGVVSSYTYDNADRLTAVSHVKGGTTTIASATYTLDSVGNRTQRVDQQGTHTYAYDNVYRLTSVTYPGPATTTYAYDAFGNRTSKVDGGGTTTYAYDNADRITSVTKPGPTTVNYTWDNNGNLTNRGSDTFAWDVEDRMTSATVGGTTTTFAYRGDGLRASRTTGGVTTSFTWDINSGLPVVIDDGNQYVYGAGLTSQKQGGNWYYYLADGLGSTMAIVNASGAVQNSYTYDVYGKPTKTGSLANEFDFAGQQTDATGLQYLRARYMDPETGGFVSREPLSVLAVWTGNPSAYGAGNPVMLSDPSGSRPCHDPDGPCGGGSASSGRAGCSAYTYGLGVCAGGDWTAGNVVAILNAQVRHAKDSKFANLNGGANFCTDVGKKSKSRTISLGGGEYAAACNGVSLRDLDPAVTCEGKLHSSYGPGLSFGVYGGQCFNQFGGAVGGFAVSLDSGDWGACGQAAVISAIETGIAGALIAGATGTVSVTGGGLAGLLVGAGVACALSGTWSAIS